MTVVIDASLLVSLVANDPRAEAINELFAGWHASDEAMHAPALTPFEVANGLTRLIASGALPADRIDPAWQAIQGLPIIYHPLRDAPPVIRLPASWSGAAPTTPPTSGWRRNWTRPAGRSTAGSSTTPPDSSCRSGWPQKTGAAAIDLRPQPPGPAVDSAMEGCVFCEIVAGRAPTYRLLEDEHTVSFLNIAPASFSPRGTRSGAPTPIWPPCEPRSSLRPADDFPPR